MTKKRKIQSSIPVQWNGDSLLYSVSCYHLMSMCFTNRGGLCCKMGTEFAAYYKAVEEHPGEEDR